MTHVFSRKKDIHGSMVVLAPDFGLFDAFYSRGMDVLAHSFLEKELCPGGNENLTMNQAGPTAFI